MNLSWYEYALFGTILNWIVCIVVSWVYILWLWLISRDIKFEGLIAWRFILPIARFRLISQKSWYARLWKGFYGFGGLFLAIIHKDKPGGSDDIYVEKIIVHEIRHVLQVLILGTFFWILFGLTWLFIKIFTKKHPYYDHPAEIDARRAASNWERSGCPRIYNFGKRN